LMRHCCSYVALLRDFELTEIYISLSSPQFLAACLL
jgi:hypothetical protein